jgi:hypothetical protein
MRFVCLGPSSNLPLDSDGALFSVCSHESSAENVAPWPLRIETPEKPGSACVLADCGKTSLELIGPLTIYGP